MCVCIGVNKGIFD